MQYSEIDFSRVLVGVFERKEESPLVKLGEDVCFKTQWRHVV
jgi:hypothetical protein